MKKLYLILFAIFAMLTWQGAAAQDIPARIVLDDASHVSVSINDDVRTDLVDGLNIFMVYPHTTITIEACEGYVLRSVKETNGDYEYDMPVLEQRVCYLNFYSDYGDTYVVTTASSTDVRTATATVNVDDASKVRLVRKATDTEVELTDGANSVTFDPATETEFVLTPTDKPLASVKVDGTDITATSEYSYTITVADGTVIDIEANYPDVKYMVTLSLSGDDAEDFISGVDIDGRPFFDYTSGAFEVAAGAEVKIYGRTSEYEVDSFKVNGRPATFSNPFAFIATMDANLEISVYKYLSFKMKVVVDDPARVHVYRGYSYNNEEYALTAGENTVEVTRNTPIISIVPAEGCYIASLDLTGEAYTREELQVSPVMLGSLTSADVITITTGVIVRDRKAVVYINDLSEAEGYFSMLRADRSAIEGLKAGYNSFDFYEGDNAFIVRTGAPVASYVYVNDNVQAESYPASGEYRLDLEDGDAVKVFFGERPALHNVSVEVAEGMHGVTLVADHLRAIDHTAGSFAALAGTHVCLSAPADAVVTLDSEELAADADGNYTFAVSGDHAIKVSAKMGIEGIEADGSDAGRWFNLLGMPIDAPSGAGIYIRDGKKVIIK